MSDRIPNSPPLIPPVSDRSERPLWSVMIPSYNCINYLKQTLLSVLAQDPGPDKMQIEIIDDHSTDADVGAMVAELGKGRVGFFRQEKNVGSLRNFETCLNRSIGKYIHILHGDDLVKPGFYNEIDTLFQQFPEAGAAFTGYLYIDGNDQILYPNKPLASRPGIIKDWFFTIARSQQIQPPSMVVKRCVYEQLGGFFACHYGEDWEMWVRISSRYPVAHSPRHLAKYRVHNENITSRSFASCQNIKDISRVIEIIQDYLPKDNKKKLKSQAKKHFAIYFARTSDMVYHGYGNPPLALAQAMGAFRMHPNPVTFFYVCKLYLKTLIRYKFQELPRLG